MYTRKDIRKRISWINNQLGYDGTEVGSFALDHCQPGDAKRTYKVVRVFNDGGAVTELTRERLTTRECVMYLNGLLDTVDMFTRENPRYTTNVDARFISVNDVTNARGTTLMVQKDGSLMVLGNLPHATQITLTERKSIRKLIGVLFSWLHNNS